MTLVIEFVVGLLILVGAFFGLMGSVGLVRLPDFFCRLHAPTKASTLGVGAILLAALLLPVAYGGFPGLVELLLTLFIFISAPVSANMLSLASLRLSGRDPEPLAGGSGEASPGSAEALSKTAGARDPDPV